MPFLLVQAWVKENGRALEEVFGWVGQGSAVCEENTSFQKCENPLPLREIVRAS